MLLSISPRLTLVSLSIAPVMGMSAMLYGLHARRLAKRLRAVPLPERGGVTSGRREEGGRTGGRERECQRERWGGVGG
jgi:hypothetical protein